MSQKKGAKGQSYCATGKEPKARYQSIYQLAPAERAERRLEKVRREQECGA